MENAFKEIADAYMTLVKGKRVDMSGFYSAYPKYALKRLRTRVNSRISDMKEELSALQQQLKDIDACVSVRNKMQKSIVR